MVNGIYFKDKNIFRVIYCDKDNLLVIDCRKRNMPKWVNSGFLNEYEIIDQDRLLNELNIKFLSEENMSKFQIKEMRNRYSSISGPLLRIADVMGVTFEQSFIFPDGEQIKTSNE